MRDQVARIEGEVEPGPLGACENGDRLKCRHDQRHGRVATSTAQVSTRSHAQATDVILPEVRAKARDRKHNLLRALRVEVVLAAAESGRAVRLCAVSIA